MSDPKEIWLQPWCVNCDNHIGEGRQWCEDDIWDKCEDCGNKPTRYVLDVRAAGKESDMSEQLERRSLMVFSTTKDRRVAHTGGQGNSSEECEEYARRLVAVWNACVGIPTKSLEGNTLPELAQIVADAQNEARATDAERLLVRITEWAACAVEDTTISTITYRRELLRAIRDARAFLDGHAPQPDPNVKLGDEVEQEGGK